MFRRWIWHLGPGRRRPGWRRELRRIERVAALSPEALGAWRAEALATHLRWVREHVPFHGRHDGAPDALGTWPILERETLQGHFEDLRDHARPVSALMENASGGSTGEPVRLYQDEAYWVFDHANSVWLDRWWGVEPWSPTVALWGVDAPGSAGWKARLEAKLLGSRVFDVFDLDDERLEEIRVWLERKRPQVLFGYVSALDALARHVARHGGLAHRLRLLHAAAETLDDARRARIESAFGLPVRDLYGSRESASMAAQCAEGRYHVLLHGRILEIVDAEGRPCPPGERGRVLVTDLSNRAFGLVRYANGDVAAWSAEGPCPCGLAYPVLERIHGRTSDFIATPGGTRIHGEWFSHLFYGQPGVERFQVRQDAEGRVRLLTVGPADATALAPQLQQIRERLGAEADFAWERVEEIPLTRTGKHRFTVSEVPWS